MADDVVLSAEDIEQQMSDLPEWEVHDGWLRRKFKTPGWSHTMLLANAIAFVSEAAWHHPDLALGYAQVVVKLQTHRARGITQHDVDLARKIEEIATWQPAETSALDGFPKTWIR